jgi:photosystem II stability/assembly factor-like uncharacterized protein
MPPSHRRRRSLLASIVLAAILLPAASHAQEYLDTLGRWKTVNRAPWSGFPDDRSAASELYFRDRETGFLMILRDGKEVWYRTTDGGATWQRNDPAVVVPHRMLDSTFGVSPGGAVTTDGVRWHHLLVDGGLAVTAATAFDRDRIAVLYRDGTSTRLAVTTDGGVRWLRLDSLALVDGNPRILSATPFGPLPIPDTATAPWHQWWTVAHWSGPDRFVAIVDAQAHPYLVTFDLSRRTLDTVRLPEMRQAPGMLDASTIYYFSMRRDSATGLDLPARLHLSTDGGRTWDTSAVPSWLDHRSFTLTSPAVGLARNARTSDAGRTWSPLVHPYHSSTGNVLVRAVDDRTIVVAGPGSLFARSTDGGATWRQNAAGGRPVSIGAHRGRVVVGREYGSIAVSLDSGETWRELASRGEVPGGMTRLWSVDWPDSVNEPDRVVAVAGFFEPDRSYRVHIVESDDAGRTWRRGARIGSFESFLEFFDPAFRTKLPREYNTALPPTLSTVATQYLRDSATGRSVGFMSVQRSLVRSTDAGRTWTELCDSIAFVAVAMSDARRGVAASNFTISRPAAIYTTTDGGTSWRWARTLASPVHWVYGVGVLRDGRYQVLAPNMNRMNQLYSFTSSDYGETWVQTMMTRSGFDINGRLLWLDTHDLHVFYAGGSIGHSTDGGESFHALHTVEDGFTDVIMAYDGSYAYIASLANHMGRWRIAHRWRAAPSAIDGDARPATATIAPNPAADVALLRLDAGGAERVTIAISDVLGRRRVTLVEELAAHGPTTLRLPLTGLEPGAYLCEVILGDRRLVQPILVRR